MDISEDTIKGLSHLQNDNIINDATFANLLEIAVSQLCDKAEGKYVSQFYGSKPDVIKKSFASLLTLLTCAARLDFDADKFSETLKQAPVAGSKLQKLCDVYASNKGAIKSSLEKTGSSLPHIVDINWRLDYRVKSDLENVLGTPSYTVELTTIRRGKLEKTTFTCSMQQLQELVYKLKDAVRHVEKIANA